MRFGLLLVAAAACGPPPDTTWVQGQTSEKGARIYLTTLEFSPTP